jgi:DHA1 family tetracycline resistance protein-like MFS transporter
MKRSPLIIIFVTVFIDLLGFGLILPNIPVYIQHYGGKPWVGGALLACFSITQFIFGPIWGRLSDRVGRRPLILLSLAGSAVSFFFFGAAPNLLVLFIARVAAGVLTSASLPTAQAYIADVTAPEKRAGGMAIIGAAFGLGFALGPVFGGILSQHPIWHITALAMPAYAAALLSLANFAVAIFLLPETHRDRTPTQHRDDNGVLDVFPAIVRAMRSPIYGAPLTVFAFSTFAFTAVESSFSWLIILRFRDLIHRSAMEAWNHAHPAQIFDALPLNSHVGIIAQQDLIDKAAAGATTSVFTVVGVTILLTQFAVMGGLARRVGENRLVMFGSLLLTVSLIAIAFVNDMMWLRVLSAFIAIGNGVLNPSLSSLITQTAGPNNRGAISGAQQGLGSLARIIAPPINNTLVGIWTGIPFLGSAVIMAGAFILSLRLHPIVKTWPSSDAANTPTPNTPTPEHRTPNP